MTTLPSSTETKEVRLRWTGDGKEYSGGTSHGDSIIMDAEGIAGPGPMDALLLSLAGCMAVDLQVILERSRVSLTGLEVSVEGERAPAPPKRYTRIRLWYFLEGPEARDEAKIERAIQLSREKFCSVLHSLRPDIELEIGYERS